VHFSERAEFVWTHVLAQGFESPFGTLSLDDGVYCLLNRDILGECSSSGSFLEK
jgi:hypothetical protein